MTASLLRRGTAALALLALSACTSLIPSYQRPAPPVASSWPEASTGAPVASPAAGAAATAAAELPWSDFLADARIRALVEIAQRNNRDLRAGTGKHLCQFASDITTANDDKRTRQIVEFQCGRARQVRNIIDARNVRKRRCGPRGNDRSCNGDRGAVDGNTITRQTRWTVVQIGDCIVLW